MALASDFDDFIPLDRTFFELALDKDTTDDVELTRMLGSRKSLQWADLLSEHRVILLSEAGAGKTVEIRNAARELRRQGKHAFFLRIEHLVQDLEDAFEEGNVDEFNRWVRSGEEGWLLLDSVDEARLRDPKDFERAIRKVGRLLNPVLDRAHVLITGRTTAWRARTDLLLCRNALPLGSDKEARDDHAPDDDAVATSHSSVDRRTHPAAPFKLVSLEDLHGPQIDAFLLGKRVVDATAFRQAVERKDAWSLTTRPQDLAELIEYWNEHRRIGSRLELLQSSISRRLEERDQDRSEARPIATDRVRRGVQLVAAACTLCQESAIRVPDGAENAKGLAIKDVLTDWDDIDCATLLSRPIFDEGIYGTVRFHHRSVREYLTAEWLHGLMVDDASRSRIEGLFFRSQYGIEVVVPTTRPVLPWLAILDARVLARICRLVPEVIFEGGDPSRLPLETRAHLLRQACEQLAQPAHNRSLSDFDSVQRFASADLTGEIRQLLARYAEDDEITWFLLSMVWKGEITGAATEAKQFAVASRAKYTRLIAFRALHAVGSPEDQEEVRAVFLHEGGELNRDWLAELVRYLPRDRPSVDWLLKGVGKAPPRKQYEVDSLSDAVADFVNDCPLPFLPELVSGLCNLLKKPPVIERRFCELSRRYGWLAPHAGQAVARLIDGRDESALANPSLTILRRLPIAQDYGDAEIGEIQEDLRARVAGWPALNHLLFWYDVAETRAGLDKKKGERLTDHIRVGMFHSYWGFGADAFDTICADVSGRRLLDDRLVALSLAFAIYRENGRPRAWRDRLKKLAHGNPRLEAALASLLHPPAKDRARWRQQQLRWKRREARAIARGEENKRLWKEHLSGNLDALRESGRQVVTNAQHYLYQRMRSDSDSSGKWSEGNWQSLIPEFGEPIATAFREGVVNFWRGHRPRLRSEGGEANSTPLTAIIGLIGLSIEARERADWLAGLSENEAELATRYALFELNGFANWLPSLYLKFPRQVIDVVVTEIDHEIATAKPDTDSPYVLHDASWSGAWMWDRLAPRIVDRLSKTPKNNNHLRDMLSIVQGSPVADEVVARLSARKAKSTRSLITGPMWFAAWVGAEPAVAIPALTARLAEIPSAADRSLFSMRFITALLGGRRESRAARQRYRTVEFLKSLYLLMNEHIREKEDIQRAGKGVYSPGLRDDAQDARNALFTFIRETSGKEAYVALMEIAKAHPSEDARPWMAFHAKQKATLDADLGAWSARQVREFHEQLERTPSNHRDLWYLAIDRLLDLKYDLEEGDSSIASLLQPIDQETEIRKYIGNWCRERSNGRYVIPQEEELADAKRPDLRFHGIGFDGPVPTELKLADKWTGPHLFERLEIQLCGDYLRDRRSSRGIFALVFHGSKASWMLPGGKTASSFAALVEALQSHWETLAPQFPGIEDIRVIGIDLTQRGIDAKARAASAKEHDTCPPE